MEKINISVKLSRWVHCLLFSESLEKAMAPHSSTLAWKIPWTEEPGNLQSMGSLRVGHDWATSLSVFTFPELEKAMAPHSSTLAWRIPGMVEPGGLPSMGSHRVRHDWSDFATAAAAAKALFSCSGSFCNSNLVIADLLCEQLETFRALYFHRSKYYLK